MSATSVRRGAGLLAISTITVGGSNYLYSLALIWMLPQTGYAVFAAGQALLLVGATVASSSVPWVLSHEIASAPGDAARRGDAVSFALLAGLGQAGLASLACALVTLRFSSMAVAVTLALSTFAIFYGSTAVGYLQGFERFRLITILRISEVALKIAAGLGLVAAGAGVVGALAGFGVAAALVVTAGAVFMARDLHPRLRSLRVGRLWRQAAGLLGIQGSVALLASLDVILASVILGPQPGVARYQVSMILSRIPMFFSAALSMAVFPRLAAGATPSPRVMASALNLFLRVAVPMAVVIATIPSEVIDRVFPASYSGVTQLLPVTAGAGALGALVNLVTTFFQARARFRRCTLLLGAAACLQAAGVVVGLRTGGIFGLAVATLLGLTVIVAGLMIETNRQWRGSVRIRMAVAVSTVMALPLIPLRSYPAVWLAYAFMLAVVTGWFAFIRGQGADEDGDAAEDSGPGLRILHLGFEDHLRPGSGGGAARNREINRRLAPRHRITVLTARYPGCRDRLEDGVRYIHLGFRRGAKSSLVTYSLSLPFALARHPSDLVVEDFAAPCSSALIPLWTRRPVLGLAQWLFAREKSRQYHLPFFLIERLGVRLHRRIIAVSSELAGQLREMNPRLRVDIIPNGVERQRLRIPARDRHDLVFLGRIEVEQKGLDILLQAFALVAPRLAGNLLIAGDGPDLVAVRRICTGLGLDQRVNFLGRVGGRAKLELLARATAVCVPSRYETFGMVALEALAVGTPVVAFNIPCLREIVPPGCGVIVPAFDIAAFGEALVSLVDDVGRRDATVDAGPRFAARFDWDQLAVLQEAVYLDTVSTASQPEAGTARQSPDLPAPGR